MSPALESPTHYSLIVQINAVKLACHGSEAGSIATIPPGSILHLQGPSAISRMVEVKWHDSLYAVFEEDLARRGQLLNALSRPA